MKISVEILIFAEDRLYSVDLQTPQPFLTIGIHQQQCKCNAYADLLQGSIITPPFPDTKQQKRLREAYKTEDFTAYWN